MGTGSNFPDKLTLRCADLRDAHAIFNLIRSHPNELVARPLGDVVQNIDRFIVGEAGGEVVGCAAWYILPEIGEPSMATIEIQSVAIRQDWQKRRLGTRLVREVMQRIEPLRAAQYLVLTFTPPFFASLGFREIPKTRIMHKIYMGCMNCTKYANPFTCPEVAMVYNPQQRH